MINFFLSIVLSLLPPKHDITICQESVSHGLSAITEHSTNDFFSAHNGRQYDIYFYSQKFKKRKSFLISY